MVNSPKLKNILISLIVLPIWIMSLISIYEDRSKISNKITGIFENNSNENNLDSGEYSFEKNDCFSNRECIEEDIFWANEIMNGGYILHFRHAERDKWIDVQMYDSLESDVHDNGFNESRLAELDYFKDAVCLNERGMIQAQAMGEHLRNINFPIGYVISSPICRSRQTAEIIFGGYDELSRILVHRGPYKETIEQHVDDLTKLYKSLNIYDGKNTIVSSHNGVIHSDMFNYSVLDTDQYELEEGGFYVISLKDDELILEHSFYFFNNFIKQFYPRGS